MHITTSPSKPTSETKHLLSLPPGIRVEIICSVPNSSTGFVSLSEISSRPFEHPIYRFHESSPYSPGPLNIISHTIPLVNKQLRKECAPLLWERNTLLTSPRDLIKLMDAPSLAIFDLLDVRHLKLRINLLSAENWCEEAFRRLAPWVVTGSLKSVCLTLVNPEDPDLTD